MKHLVRDLENLKKEILTVGSLVEEATNKAITSLVDRRPELAEEVLAGDDEIDKLEVTIEEECLKVLALHQPVASDLRFVVTILKVNNDLERMGDHAANIAERAAFLCSQPPIEFPGDLRRMALKVRDMVRGSLDALVNVDMNIARKVMGADATIDVLHRDMFQGLQDLMRRQPDSIERAVNTLSASRHLERIADLCTNIAEDVVFLVEGEVVRHRSP
ncbi:MAG: phosphate signaling complex protein PhoU [Planctomycetota bacterium]